MLLSPLYITIHRLYAIHFAYIQVLNKGAGFVKRCTATSAAKIEAKNQQATTKGAQIKGREDLIIGDLNFQRALIAMLQKQNMPNKIEQRTIVSG